MSRKTLIHKQLTIGYPQFRRPTQCRKHRRKIFSPFDTPAFSLPKTSFREKTEIQSAKLLLKAKILNLEAPVSCLRFPFLNRHFACLYKTQEWQTHLNELRDTHIFFGDFSVSLKHKKGSCSKGHTFLPVHATHQNHQTNPAQSWRLLSGRFEDSSMKNKWSEN